MRFKGEGDRRLDGLTQRESEGDGSRQCLMEGMQCHVIVELEPHTYTMVIL